MMRWRSVIVLMLLLVACGSTATHTGADGSTTNQDPEEAEIHPYPAVGQIRSGAVIYGGRRQHQGEVQLGAAGRIVDDHGRTRTTFDTEDPFDRATFVDLGDRVMIAGVPCSHVNGQDPVSGDLECVPGGVAVHSIDVATGEVTEIELPEQALGGVPVTRGPVEIYSAGEMVVLRTPQEDGDGERLWLLDEKHWSPLPSMTGRMCSTSTRLVAYDVIVAEGALDIATMVPARAAVSALDPIRGVWGPWQQGPEVQTPSGTAFGTVACTQSSVVFIPATAGPTDLVRFHPESNEWATVPTDRDIGASPYAGFLNSERLVASDGALISTIDAVDGRVEVRSELSYEPGASRNLVTLGAETALVVDLESGTWHTQPL